MWRYVLGLQLTPDSWTHHWPQASCGSEDTPGLQSAGPSGIKIHPGVYLVWSNQTPQAVFSCFKQQNHWYWSYVCLLPNLQYGILKQLKHWFNLNNFSFKVFYPLRVPFSPHPSTQLQLCPSTIQMCPLRISGQLTHTCSFHKLHKLFSVSLFFFFF